MNVVRFDPFREMTALHERVNRAFGDLSRRYDDDLTARGSWVPAVDIYQTDNHALVLKVELPGVVREDIDLRVENDTLTISGQKHRGTTVREDHYHRIERTFASFSRTFTLPPTVDPGKIGAEYKNGVLSVILPLREDARPRQIQVTVN